jgi:integrase
VLLSSILETAVEYGYLQSNPARGVKFPQALKKKPAMIAGDDFAKLLEQLNEPYRTMVRLIAATGLRIGELLALRWSSLNLEVGALSVRVRGQVPGAEDPTGFADDSARSVRR